MTALAQRIVRAMGGDWYGTYGMVPALGHSRKDRSVSIRPHSSDPDDVVVNSFTGDASRLKADLRERGLLPVRAGRPRTAMPQQTRREPVERRLRPTRS